MECLQVCLQVVHRSRGPSDACGYDSRRDTQWVFTRRRTTLAESVVSAATSLVWTSSAPHDEAAAMQPILHDKFSPGFDKLEEELRTFAGLVKTYHAIFGEAISDSITQAVIKSQMLAEIRTYLDLQTFARTSVLVSLMSSLSKMRTAATSSSSAEHGPVPMEARAKGRAEKCEDDLMVGGSFLEPN